MLTQLKLLWFRTIATALLVGHGGGTVVIITVTKVLVLSVPAVVVLVAVAPVLAPVLLALALAPVAVLASSCDTAGSCSTSQWLQCQC